MVVEYMDRAQGATLDFFYQTLPGTRHTLVRFPILLRDYLVIETAPERGVNKLFTAVLLLIYNALPLLQMMY